MTDAARWANNLAKIDHAQRPYELFRDFCTLAYHAHAKTAATSADAADAHEREYMATVKRNKADAVRAMPELMAQAIEAVQAGGSDFLGNVAGEIGALDPKYSGQVFTPFELSRLIAMQTIGDPAEIIESQGYVSICEPASGAGSMILAVADHFENLGHDPGLTMLIQATDRSPLCYHMTYLQFTWRGIPAAVIHGDSLSLEQFASAWTPAALLRFLPHHGHLGQRPTPENPEVDTDPPAIAAAQPEQISLF